MHGKLQGEKARLAIAIQACEAAAASISRPSSPQDIMPAPIPHQEVIVRTRLEDLIDQVKIFLYFLCILLTKWGTFFRSKLT